MIFCFAFGYWWSRTPRPRAAQLNGTLRFYHADGSVAETSDLFAAEALLIFLLSTECPVCTDIAPAWRELARRTANAAKGSIQVHVLSHSTGEDTKAFLRTHELDHLQVLYLDEEALRAVSALAMPSTLLVTRDEDALYWDGVLSADDVKAISNRLVLE